MLSSQEAFKLGFLSQCVEDGFSIEEMRSQVKAASDALKQAEKDAAFSKVALFGELADDAGDVAKNVANLGLTSLLLAPPALGAAAGYTHSRLSDVDDEDVEDVKKRELIDEYRRQAEKLRQTARLRTFRESRKKRSGGLYL